MSADTLNATKAAATIHAVAELWPLVLIATGIVILIIYRKPFREFLEAAKLIKIKGPGVEASLERDSSQGAGSSASKDEATPPIPAPSINDLPEQKSEHATPFWDMYHALANKKPSDAKEAFERLQAEEKDFSKRDKNEIFYLQLKYVKLGDTAALQKLDDFSKDPRTRSDASYWLAYCHEYSRNYPKAIEVAQKALSFEMTDDDRSAQLRLIARCFQALGKPDEAISTLTDGLSKVQENKAVASLYKALADVYKKMDERIMEAVALQKALQFEPENTDILFAAAYAQSNTDLFTLGVLNYSTLIRFEPENQAALNNMGVACAELDAPFKAVSFYTQAVEHNYTLAMANLAYKYIGEGFLKEANDILEKAMKLDSPHKNVGEAWARLQAEKEKEISIWDDAIKLGTTYQQFFWNYGEACFHNSPVSFTGKWKSPTGNVISILHTEKNITGKFEAETTGEELQGDVSGFAVATKYRVKKLSFGTYYSWTDFENGFAYLERDGETLTILFPEKKSSRMIVLTRQLD